MADAVYGIRLHGLRWLAQSNPAGPQPKGWQPFRWTLSLEDAEKFDSAAEALWFIKTKLPLLMLSEAATIRPIYPTTNENPGYA